MNPIAIADVLSWCVEEGESSVVEALQQQYDIRKCVIYRQYGHRGQDTLHYSAKYIEYISGKPDNEEKEGKPVSGATSEILDDLRREHNDPACNGDGAGREG